MLRRRLQVLRLDQAALDAYHHHRPVRVDERQIRRDGASRVKSRGREERRRRRRAQSRRVVRSRTLLPLVALGGARFFVDGRGIGDVSVSRLAQPLVAEGGEVAESLRVEGGARAGDRDGHLARPRRRRWSRRHGRRMRVTTRVVGRRWWWYSAGVVRGFDDGRGWSLVRFAARRGVVVVRGSPGRRRGVGLAPEVVHAEPRVPSRVHVEPQAGSREVDVDVVRLRERRERGRGRGGGRGGGRSRGGVRGGPRYARGERVVRLHRRATRARRDWRIRRGRDA